MVLPAEVEVNVALAGAQIEAGEATIPDGFAGKALTTTGM